MKVTARGKTAAKPTTERGPSSATSLPLHHALPMLPIACTHTTHVYCGMKTWCTRTRLLLRHALPMLPIARTYAPDVCCMAFWPAYLLRGVWQHTHVVHSKHHVQHVLLDGMSHQALPILPIACTCTTCMLQHGHIVHKNQLAAPPRAFNAGDTLHTHHMYIAECIRYIRTTTCTR